MLGALIALLASLGVGSGAIVLVIKNLLYICQPNEVLIFAGANRKYRSKMLGYRTVKGGRSIRTPIFEKAYKMDLTNMIIDLKVANAYSKGGIPLTVNGVANIKIAGEEPTIHNAIERLLGKTRKQIETIARETLEGNLRGVLSSLTPEQVNEDKIAFAQSLLEEAEDDLEKLGLVLDNLQIQNISDDVGYLDSLGRKQGAELLRDARIAEAQAKAESVIQQADNDRKTSIKRIETQIEIAKAEAERRVQDALTKRNAVVAESESQIASELAKTQADLLVQAERIKQVKQQLQADVVAPAEANCQRAIAEAKGKAASIIEDGKAQAEGTKRLAESWQQAGQNAREIFLFQKLETLLSTMVASVPEVDVQHVTVIDSQGGTTATKTASFLEQLRQTTGIDVTGVVNKLGGGNSQLAPANTNSNLGQSSAEEATRLYSEVQQLLNKLAEKNPSQVQTEETVARVIKRSPQLKSRLRRALEAGGDAAIDMLFEHPLVNIPSKMVEAWVEE